MGYMQLQPEWRNHSSHEGMRWVFAYHLLESAQLGRALADQRVSSSIGSATEVVFFRVIGKSLF
jgi:hypothetical protein